MSEHARVAILAGLFVLLGGCGQTGRLYLPEPAGEVVTRPTQTPAGDAAPAPAPAAPEEKPDDKKNAKKN